MLRNLVVVSWCAVIGALGVRGLVREDARYAWGMFNYVMHYELTYAWRMPDGQVVPHKPGQELKKHKKRLAAGRWHKTLYGLGSVRDDVDAYARFMIARPLAGATAFETRLRFKKHLGPAELEVRSMPVTQVTVTQVTVTQVPR